PGIRAAPTVARASEVPRESAVGRRSRRAARADPPLKVLVDTSAWVDFLNEHESAMASALAELLQGQDDICTCGLVVTEVFQGLRNERGRSDIARFFRDMTFLEPSGADSYLRAAELFRRLRDNR